MVLKINNDHNRFKEIVKGQIKKDLKRYVSNGELIGKKGKDLVSIPIPRIDLPRFVYSHKKVGGVGQGDGKVGTPIGGDGQEEGVGQAGDSPGAHILEVDITLEELAKILGEELELPNIEPKGQKNIRSTKERYTGIHRSGPEGLRHFKRTYKSALKRQISTGTYDAKNPTIIPIREDKRYRSWRVVQEPASNAVIFYIMDVSGSMGNEQKEIVRTESFWIDTWLKSQYKGLECRYIIHDATAREVDSETFYHTRESGGTIISSAYKLCQKIMNEEYSPADWNIYVFHFSDGDNWSGEDTLSCIQLLKNEVLPDINLFCYGQVESQYGTGQFLKDLQEGLTSIDNVALSKIESKDDILASIRTFLGKGK
jgi:sporulation protein YhbH